jgi:hypothetical protein
MRAIAALLFLLPLALFAQEQPDFQKLSLSARWQALLHINHGATLRDRGESYVDDDNYFLAPQGSRDAQAELEASWRALKPAGAEARCRFPARYRYLAESLGWDDASPLAHCQEYIQWRKQMPLGQLVLVFPASYLNSPSSMFGHTLLRLDEKPDPDSVWLSKAINFGAQVNTGDNSVAYIWRGLAGGYPGRFSIVPYVEKIQEYSHLENRDMWEYALKLDRDDLDWVVRHLWELRGINFDYYFFDENCSFRLLELIAVARPEAPLMEGYRFAEVPVRTVRALYRADLVAERRYRPSKAVELDHLASRLSHDEKQLAQALMREGESAAGEAFQRLPEQRRHLVASLAYQTLRFRYRKEERSRDVSRRSLAMLRLMQANDAPAEEPIEPPPAPETGHATKMLTAGFGRREGVDFGELGWRFTYHGVLDPLTGFMPGAGIEGLDLRLRSTDSDRPRLERLDVVEIRSLSPRNRFVKPVSWLVHGGLERAQVDDRRELLRFFQGGAGLTWQWGSVMPYALVLGRVENASGWRPFLQTGGGAELGVLYPVSGIQLGLRSRGIYFQNDTYRHETGVTVNLPLSRNHAVRAECRHQGWRGETAGECSLEYRFFFD